MKENETYHDYVIKDGKFIGRFDEMYEKFSDPWTQSEQPNQYARTAGIIHLRKFAIGSLVECGCGLGYYADRIQRDTGITPKSLDISPVAIRKAKVLFPHLDFEVSDICKNIHQFKNYEAVMFSEILWYILPHLDGLLQQMELHFKNKYLLINQVFYKGTQKYGNEYFTDLNTLIDYIPFQLLGRCEATTINDSTLETSTIFRI